MRLQPGHGVAAKEVQPEVDKNGAQGAYRIA